MAFGSIADREGFAPDRGLSPRALKRQVALLRRWPALFVGVAAPIFLIGVLAVFLLPPRYRAAAEVMIDPRPERVVELNQVLPGVAADSAAVDTEVEVLRSRSLAERTAARLGLDRDPEFNRGRTARIALPWRSARAVDPMDAAVDRLLASLKVSRIGFTSVIAVSATSRSPEKAARIANTVVAFYLQQQLDAKTSAARRASGWLNERLGGLRAEVESAEHAVERYRSAHGLMTLTNAQGQTLTEQEISNLDTQLATARDERAEAEARLSAATARVGGGGQGDDVGEVLNSPVVQELRKQRDALAKDLADLSGRYGPRHPEILKAERQRAELDSQLKQEIARVLSNLKVQADVARGRSTAIESTLGRAKASLAASNNASVELKELERNLDSVRTLYQSFLDRIKQTSAQEGMAQPDARIVSRATPPLLAEFPNHTLMSSAALLAAGLAGLLAVWIADVREDGLYDAGDVEARLALPCLGLVPTVGEAGGGALSEGAAPTRLLTEQPLSMFTESFRTLRAGILFGRTPPRTLAVTSALPGEGKTTTCMGLGRMLARTDVSVVIVDCDLRRRGLNRLLVEPSHAGLVEVLAGEASLDEVLIADDGLTLLPLGEEYRAEEDILESAAMDRLLETLRRRFRLVILDTAPVLLVTETRTLAAKADATLFVARWRRTPAEAASGAVRILEGAGARLVGATLTQVDPRHMEQRAYGYGAADYPFYRRVEAARRVLPS